MKLALLSNPLIKNSSGLNDAIQALFSGKRKKIAYIPAQTDFEMIYANRNREWYRKLGLDTTVYFDVDKEYDPGKTKEIFKCSAIHLSGGSTYHFLDNLQKTGLTSQLKMYAENGGILIGVSAGAIIMTPTIRSAKLCGDEVVPDVNESGLNLVSFEFIPHFDFREKMTADVVEYSRTTNNSVVACPDGDGIVVEDGKITRIGNLKEYQNGNAV